MIHFWFIFLLYVLMHLLTIVKNSLMLYIQIQTCVILLYLLLLTYRQSMDEFTVVANSWRYGKSYISGLLFFAMADYDDAPDIFTSVICFMFIFILWFHEVIFMFANSKGGGRRVHLPVCQFHWLQTSADEFVYVCVCGLYTACLKTVGSD